jgi:hypothetical protein
MMTWSPDSEVACGAETLDTTDNEFQDVLEEKEELLCPMVNDGNLNKVHIQESPRSGWEARIKNAADCSRKKS